MKILGIETATAICSTAVINGQNASFERHMDAPEVHSQKLLVLIDEVLSEAGEKLDSIDGIAISIGPGSFTGLRIGLSAAKGLSYAARKPLLPVSTLEALAYSALRRELPDGNQILVVLDARRDEFYAAMYRRSNNGLQETILPAAFPAGELKTICFSGEKIIVTGNGAEKFLNYLQKEGCLQGKLSITSEAERQCSAVAVAFLGSELLRQNRIADLSTLEPTYIKEFYTISQQHFMKG